jgi:hypothetical protein
MLSAMRSCGRSTSAGWLAVGLVLALGAPALAATDESEVWAPALSFYSGILGQNGDAQVSSGPVLGPRLPTTPSAEIRPPADGGDLIMASFVAMSLEVMSPALTQSFGKPRFFVHGDAAPSFAFTRTLAREGAPASCAFADPIPAECAPPPLNSNANPAVSEPTVLGQGSETSAEVKTWLFSGGAGVAFTVPVGERRIRIKPSVEYMQEEVEVEGTVHRAIRTGTPAPQAPFPDGILPRYRGIVLSGSDSMTLHGIGPGLEIEMDTRRAGPFLLSLFVSGQAYKFLGKREISFSDSNEYGETAEWNYEHHSWSYRGGVGMRFRFLPWLEER